MPDQVVSLEFQDSGVDALAAKINGLADAMDRLPSKFSFKASGGGSAAALPGGSGAGANASKPPKHPAFAVGPSQALRAAHANLAAASATGNGSAIQDAHFLLAKATKNYQQAFAPQGGGGSSAIAAAFSQVKMSVTAIASASQGGTGGVSSLVSVLSKLPPEAAVAAAAVAALVGSLVHAYNLAQSAINPSFQYGNGSYNSSHGVFRTLGTDNAYGKSRSLSDAIASNPYARSAAYRAGINPNNSLYGGDLDDPKKALQWLNRYGDPSKTSNGEAMRADRASGGVFTDEIARLRAASPDVRRMALNDQAAQMSPEKLRAAADAQLKWNHLVGEFSDLVVGAVDSISSAWKWIEDHLPGFHMGNMIGPPGAGSGKAADKEKMANDKFSDAVDRFTKTVDGVYGGGSRTRKGLPSGWGADQFQRATYQRAAPLGVL